MPLKQYIAAYLLIPIALSHEHSATRSVDPFKAVTLSADNIMAKFIPYGARLTSLLVPDRNGNEQDVVVGYDNPHQYLEDTETSHTYFGAVIGRIANRLKNGTFELDGTEYHIPKNKDGLYSLHGGDIGYDQRDWTLIAPTASSVTFELYDAAFQGFPGDVITQATYTVDTVATVENPQGRPRLTTKLVSQALTHSTPIMLSNHIYWNLNSFQQPTILNDTWLQLPLSKRFIATDSLQIPNGGISTVDDTDHQCMDFTAGKLIGHDMQYTQGLVGGDVGYDNCFIIDRDPTSTGTSMEVATNTPAVQFFTCLNMDRTIPVKPSQANRNLESHEAAGFVEKYGCLAIEAEGLIDSANNPQWGQQSNVIYSPETLPAVNLVTYTFGTV
ncbi:hypothetical protein N7476_000331 [Penicillium atrosanguineum]|uniref:Aldose 1-epimerase n=1 Tax=Penicillium atrosanguineum TaxID=1132637 RepID=A0A9W9QEA6_9EURO|nr:hypothetical protein N7476_000331 [Penicillium atrosanguineum]